MRKILSYSSVLALLGNWWVLLALCLLVLALWFIFKPEGENKKPRDKKLVAMNENELFIHAVTMEIIEALGVGFGHPIIGEAWNFTEDEEEVVRLLELHQEKFIAIADEYNRIFQEGYLGGADLILDLKNYLSASQFERVKKIWS